MSAATRTANPTAPDFRHLSVDVTRQRDRTQETAQRLSLLAMRKWEKALTGVAAIPAAAALTTGAAVLFAVSILERTFELFDTALSDVDIRVGSEGAVLASATSRSASAARATSPGAASARAASASAASASAASPGAAPVSAASASAPAMREGKRARTNPDEAWEVVLVDAGANPIALIRELRELTGKDLRDLEVLVGSVPEAVKRALPRADAESLRDRIEAAGGKVEIRRVSAQASSV